MSPHVTQPVPPPVSAQTTPTVGSVSPPDVRVSQFSPHSKGTPLLAAIQKVSLSPLAFTVTFTLKAFKASLIINGPRGGGV